MDLDVRTLLVLFSILSFMFAGLIIFTGIHTKVVRSASYWALASLCIGFGLGLCFFFKTVSFSSKLAMVAGCTLLSMSVVLQFNGIRVFNAQKTYFRFGLLFVGIVFTQTVWFEFIQPSNINRAVANSLWLGLGFAICSFMLFWHAKPELKRVTYFTGSAFAMIALVCFIRAIFIYQLLKTYILYSNVPINPNSLLLLCLLQLCITFGFLLMLNRELVTEIEHVAARDNLTGAFNRRELEGELARLQSRFERSADSFCLMLIDIDNFKLINDNYGHLVGDEMLCRFARIVFASIRTEDYFARFGGDEFCILLPNTQLNDALVLANRLREVYASTTYTIDDDVIQSTISIGVSESSSMEGARSGVVASADKALYQAKKDGRNRVKSSLRDFDS
jgi:diguanylate cyclase (GGDEF)-like protein